MKLYIYQGLDDENIPEDITHVIVDDSVTIIKEGAFLMFENLVSVIMGDNVKIIETFAFHCCYALRFIRLSKTLEYIGEIAFCWCTSLEALFLPSTVITIEDFAFAYCRSLRLLILLNNGIDLSNAEGVINGTVVQQIVESYSEINEGLFQYMDLSPFHKLCYDLFVTTRRINGYLGENGNDCALVLDTIHGMIPLHMLAMNPHAPADSIASLLVSNMEAAFCLDHQQKTPLDYAREYNVCGLVGTITELCNHKHAQRTNTRKRGRAEI